MAVNCPQSLTLTANIVNQAYVNIAVTQAKADIPKHGLKPRCSLFFLYISGVSKPNDVTISGMRVLYYGISMPLHFSSLH